MIITVYNFKGGQGKSKISLNLAYTLGYSVITNDIVSCQELWLPEDKILKIDLKDSIPHNFDSKHDIIYDLGGFIDKRVVKVLNISDWILVPVTNENDDDENIRVAIKTIDSIEEFNKNIVIIANKTEVKKSGTKILQDDFAEIKKVMSTLYSYPVLEIKKSKAMSQIAKERRSIKDIVSDGGIQSYIYSDIMNQFNNLIEYLNASSQLKAA